MAGTAALARTSLPTGRVGQALALLLLLLLGAAAWGAIGAPLMDLYGERAETLTQRQALARRMATVAAGLPDLRRMASEAAAVGPAPSALLTGASDAVAGAMLQQMVQEMAGLAGATLSSIEALPAETVGRNRQIAVRVSASATLPALVRFLTLLGGATPVLLVDDMQLRGVRVQGGNEEQPMEATLTVFGFLPGERT